MLNECLENVPLIFIKSSYPSILSLACSAENINIETIENRSGILYFSVLFKILLIVIWPNLRTQIKEKGKENVSFNRLNALKGTHSIVKVHYHPFRLKPFSVK